MSSYWVLLVLMGTDQPRYSIITGEQLLMEQKTLSSMMEEKRVFYPPLELSEKAYIKSLAEYQDIYQRSIDDPEAFWGESARQLDW